MKTTVVRAQLLVFSVITVLVVAYTLFDILGVRVGRQPMKVTVVLPTGGGIFQGSEVTYRGVRVGEVRSVDLEPDKVTLHLNINPDAKIPGNAIATVTDLSAVGEQYLDFVPAAAAPTAHLKSGAVIPPSQTKTPIRVAQVLYEASRWLDSMDPKTLQILTKEFATAFANSGPQLRQILQGSKSLMTQLADTQPQFLRLLRNGNILLEDAANHSAQFDQFTRDLLALSTTLKQVTPNFTNILDNGAEFSILVNEVMDQWGAVTAALVADVATISEIQGARIPALRALLLAVPEFAQKGPKVLASGKILGFAVINQNQPICNYGVPLTSPISGIRTPVHRVACTNGPPRGAINAPRPGAATAAAGTPQPLPGSAASSGQVLLAGYDAGGLLYPPDGSAPVQLGYTGGQQRLLGDRSWQALIAAVAGN